jgi:hypothetical protein
VQTIEIPQDGGSLFGVIFGHEASFIVTLSLANASYLRVPTCWHESMADRRPWWMFVPADTAIARSGHIRLQ